MSWLRDVLDAIPPMARVLFIIFLLGLVLLRSWWQARKRQKATIGHLDSLSAGEYLLLAYCLARNRRTVFLQLMTPLCNAATALQDKGLMQMARGTHDVLAVPFTVPDLVWAELRRRGDSFLPPDSERRATLGEAFTRLDQTAQGRPPKT
jgi:hypothetical protein